MSSPFKSIELDASPTAGDPLIRPVVKQDAAGVVFETDDKLDPAGGHEPRDRGDE
jgi:hypothetical protein